MSLTSIRSLGQNSEKMCFHLFHKLRIPPLLHECTHMHALAQIQTVLVRTHMQYFWMYTYIFNKTSVHACIQCMYVQCMYAYSACIHTVHVYSACMHTVHACMHTVHVCTVHVCIQCMYAYMHCTYSETCLKGHFYRKKTPVYRDHSRLVCGATSVILTHLCIRTTCLLRAPSLGPLSGCYRQVALYVCARVASR